MAAGVENEGFRERARSYFHDSVPYGLGRWMKKCGEAQRQLQVGTTVPIKRQQ